MEKKAAQNKRKTGEILTNIFLTPEIGVLIPIVILCVVTSFINKNFMTWKYFSGIFMGSIFIGAASLGQGFAAIAGEVDLSVGMNGCLAGIMTAVACARWNLGLVPCLLIGLASGGLVGFINGYLTCKMKLSSWITTLATQFICQGLSVTISQGEPISIKALGTSTFTRARPLGLSWLFFIFIGLVVLCDVLIRHTRYGYKLRAVGGNPNAATMAGINVDRVKNGDCGRACGHGRHFRHAERRDGQREFRRRTRIQNDHLRQYRRHDGGLGIDVRRGAGRNAVPCIVVCAAHPEGGYESSAGSDRSDSGAGSASRHSEKARGSAPDRSIGGTGL